MEAAKKGDLAKMQHLVKEEGVDVNSVDTYSWSALLWASTVVEWLFQNGADVEKKKKQFRIPTSFIRLRKWTP